MNTTKIPLLHKQVTPVKNEKTFILTQTDTTEKGCHATERLTLSLLSETEGKDPYTKVLFTFDSWMQSVKLNKENELDHIYYSDDDHKVECLEKMIESIEDSFDENPPHAKARAQMKALKDCIDIIIKNK